MAIGLNLYHPNSDKLSMKYLFFLLFMLVASPQDGGGFAGQRWVDAIHQEGKKLAQTDPHLAYRTYLMAAREMEMQNYQEHARSFYLAAAALEDKHLNKLEALVQLVTLNLADPQVALTHLERLEQWLAKNPDKLRSEIDEWLPMVRAKLGVTAEGPKRVPAFYAQMVNDEKLQTLVIEGKLSDAFNLIKAMDFEQSDINRKVLFDVIASGALGKSAPPLACWGTLQQYPDDLSWSMRICRFLISWRKDEVSKDSVATIKDQLRKESPDRLFLVQVLEKL
jgi:hypothetical protein